MLDQVTKSDDGTALIAAEQRLIGELSTAALVSTAVGTATLIAGRRSGRTDVRRFGSQTLIWAAMDLAIAGVGALTARRVDRTDPAVPERRARRLRRILLVNAGLDLGYVGGGARLARRPQRRGDGVAIVVQGLFLLWFDTRHARIMGRLEDRASERAVQ